MPVFELGPGPFWFAGIDEISGISMVVTYMVCGQVISWDRAIPRFLILVSPAITYEVILNHSTKLFTFSCN